MSALRDKLAAMIEADFARLGMTVFVEGENLHPAQGAWRTDVRLDVYRWEGFGQWFPDGNLNTKGLHVSIDSWHPMTQCVKGLKVSPDNRYPCTFEVDPI